ncbi:TPA: thiamine pyrophosphate-dependent dehydrogenase E1 component subunit alpha [archaeon]|uniref:Thiamine pyrophosphate-dependent dehydrogenase E1 component subunit alpha n=1 Tax=Candidatus Naiadarchaeum limnaeum TaxID=2756139 RepID=A0A832X5V8_9ARCH|nr:thiamine pyrophosphate-dependent dehydrogenase E1 component subunit alpha [Candidatus Naiadarchaeales archaeon SRR2090153.bin1042]HIK00200.1 thiamine pyrophosphate-dependent dehydrogenase E1 component subunit alpha [Candidatus Naiadarchaeum limnaeum]
MENKTSLSLLHKILLIRRAEEKIVELYPEQEIRCPTHLSIGQEAVAAGVCEALRKDDIIFSNHRSHGHYIAKGGNLKAMFAEFYGKATGCSKGRGGSMHLIDLSVNFLGSTPLVGGTIPIAVGAALSTHMRKEDNIVVIFIGDAAVEEGVFHESVNFSALKKLPVLFVCENNFYSVYTPLSERQPGNRKIYELAKGHGIESYQADGNDAIKVYEITKKAVDKIRSGKGPVFLEFLTYRWREHCGPNYDNDLGYRSVEELEKWKRKDPLESLKNKLLKSKTILQAEFEKIENEVRSKVEAAVKFAKESPFPKKEELEKYVYSV